MISYRVIPILLLHDSGLVKTTKFKQPKYVGDPINAIKIFNDKEVDELVFLDIDASKHKREPNFKLLEHIASECFMPLGYGGGITNISQVNRIFNIGIEKVIFNTAAFNQPTLIEEAAKSAGSQSVVVSIDVKKNWLGKKKLFSHAGAKAPNITIADFVKRMQDIGAGEIIINSVDQDGITNGYDLELIKTVAEIVDVPVVACGGAGTIQHLSEAVQLGGASAVAAGSMFVFYGPHRAVLINYPSQEKLKSVFEHE